MMFAPSVARARSRAPMLFALLALLSLVFVACHPALPPQTTCRVGSYVCVNDQPRVCSPDQRFEPVGDAPCSRVGAVCVAPIDGPAHCARAQNDAAAEAPDASDGGAE
jgi:hypothetical protein